MRSAAAKAGNPDPLGKALGDKRWKKRTRAEVIEHMRMMARCRWGAVAKLSSKHLDK